MTLFQILMLGASAFFAYKIYEHIQTLQDPEAKGEGVDTGRINQLIEEADKLLESGDFEKSLVLYSQANYEAPGDAEVLFKMGYSLMQQNRLDEALSYYKDALEIEPENAALHQALASLYRKQGEFASARIHLDRSLEIDAANPITYYNYGNLLVDMKRFDEAKTMYEKALELDGDFVEAKEELEKLL